MRCKMCVTVGLVLVISTSLCFPAEEAQAMLDKEAYSPQGQAKGSQKNEQLVDSIDVLNKELRAAVFQGQKERVEELIVRGANVDSKDSRALHIAANRGYREIVQLLLAHGAEIDVKDYRGQTPLHRAAEKGHLDVVQLLLKSGADINTKDRNGSTPMDLAQKAGHGDIVELLQKQMHIHDVAMVNVSAPKNCAQGETVSIHVTADNPGSYAESAAIKVSNDTDSVEIGSQTIDLLAGGQADLTFDSPASGLQQFGNYMYHGDVNGDGYDDLLITASRFNECQGRAYLYYGGTNMDTSPDLVFTGEDIGDYLSEGGWLTDLNRDGYCDVILGAFGHNNKQGRVYVYYGGEKTDAKADVTIDGEPGTVGKFGRTCTAGDVNGDGYEDMFVGAQQYDGDYTGRIYLYYGGESFDTNCDLILTGEKANDTFGWMIDASGDVDGDHYCDLVTATRWFDYTEGDPDRGRAYLYYGGDPMDGEADVIFTGETKVDDFGSGLEVADVDNDGRADILIGARTFNDYAGRVYLYWGKEKASMSNHPDLIFESESKNIAFGGDDIEVGNVDGDSYGDIAVAAYGYPPGIRAGRVYLYHGDTQIRINADCDSSVTFSGRNNLAQFITIGDFNNDSYGDLVVGGWGYPDGAKQGRVWLYYGGPSKCTGVTFNWDTTKASLGKHTLKVEIPPVPGEQNTEDNVKTVTIEVKEPRR